MLAHEKKAKKPLKSVFLNQAFPPDLQTRIAKYRKEKFFSSDQEVVRVGINDFLTRNGYPAKEK